MDLEDGASVDTEEGMLRSVPGSRTRNELFASVLLRWPFASTVAAAAAAAAAPAAAAERAIADLGCRCPCPSSLSSRSRLPQIPTRAWSAAVRAAEAARDAAPAAAEAEAAAEDAETDADDEELPPPPLIALAIVLVVREETAPGEEGAEEVALCIETSPSPS